MVRQAEEHLKVAQGISTCLEDNREQHKVKHSLFQLVSQRIYQIAAGYEDTNDSNYLRHDPIFKIICDKIPEIGAELFDAYTHGHQQLSLFHGYYGHQIYFPVLINEAKSGYPLIVQLRPGNSHAGKGVLGLLRWLFWRLRKAWPDVKIILRGDGGFSLPEIINLCEKNPQ